MEVPENKVKNLQWHPAFYAGIQIELEKDAANLIFENEHQLGTKPFGIDVLIIKKEKDKPIQKNIGRIFKKHNIVEYKSPRDYLSIDDFYKVYGYACFYKADTNKTDSVKIDELTISLIAKNYPRKLIQHLKNEQNYIVLNVERGIYYVIGDKIPIQIIVTKDLSSEENLWLKSLTDDLNETTDIETLEQDYRGHEKDILYQSVMNIIVEANEEKFKEANHMCEALRKIMREEMKDELDEKKNEGENLINALIQKLAQADRMNDIIKSAEDKEYQDKLIKEFGL